MDSIRDKAKYTLELWNLYIEGTWRILPCSKLRSLVVIAPELAQFVINHTEEKDHSTPTPRTTPPT